MKQALKASLVEYKIPKPHRASTSSQEVLFFDPPYEARNPELVIQSHLPRPSIMDVSKEKHVPLRDYLQTGHSIHDPEKLYKDARPKTAANVSRMSEVSHQQTNS